MSKSKKRIKQMMAKGISRSDAKAFNRVRRQIICAKDEKLRAMLPKVTDPVVQYSVCNYRTQTFREEYLMDPYQLEMAARDKIEEYVCRKMCENLIETLQKNGFLSLDARYRSDGYIQYRISLMVAMPGEEIVYGKG